MYILFAECGNRLFPIISLDIGSDISRDLGVRVQEYL